MRRPTSGAGSSRADAKPTRPLSLADLDLEPTGPDGYWEFEEFYYAAAEVFEAKGGESDVRDQSEPEAGLGDTGPSGEEFTDDDHLQKAPSQTLATLRRRSTTARKRKAKADFGWPAK